MANDLQNPIFHDEDKAREWLEARVWPNGPHCPHCGCADRVTRLAGKAHRAGTFQCNQCREQFTVTVGTVFERSKIALTKWLMAVYLLSASKKGISSHQLSRMLGISYKSTWFMTHRIREAMRSGDFDPMGGAGATVEVDETFIGRKKGMPKHRGTAHKHAVLTLVQRGGKARSFHVQNVAAKDVMPVVKANIDRETRIMTDEAGQYVTTAKHFAGGHEIVRHSQSEYVRGDAHTNTVEGFYSIFKRGMKGIYQHCGEQHLHRYLAEFDFRYSNRVKLGVNDMERAAIAAQGIVGKRLTYRRIGSYASM